MAIYTCNKGFQFKNPDITKLTCKSDKSWGQLNFEISYYPECQRKLCPQPRVYENHVIKKISSANIDQKLIYYYEDIIAYSCATGYVFDNNMKENLTSKCGYEETWSLIEPPRCVPIKCGIAPPRIHGSFLNMSNANRTFYYQDVLEYFCDQGYEYLKDNDGFESISCTENGYVDFITKLIKYRNFRTTTND